MTREKQTAVLLFSCRDQTGLVSKLTQLIYVHGGNILDLNEHVDPEEKMFSIRIAWEMQGFSKPPEQVWDVFSPLAKEVGAHGEIHFLEEKTRAAIFVSKVDHAAQEILWRHKMNEFPIEIALMVSNHPDLEALATHHNIPFHCYPKTSATRLKQEKEELKLLRANKVDTIILARYMQILSPAFVKQYQNKIINIHHSFLPAFVGSNPYRQAFHRGVKIIGATSHYVTDDLDEGPIIAQDVIRISHKDTLKDLIRKGRDLERLVLARALRSHFEHRVLVHGRKTIVFE